MAPRPPASSTVYISSANVANAARERGREKGGEMSKRCQITCQSHSIQHDKERTWAVISIFSCERSLSYLSFMGFSSLKEKEKKVAVAHHNIPLRMFSTLMRIKVGLHPQEPRRPDYTVCKKHQYVRNNAWCRNEGREKLHELLFKDSMLWIDCAVAPRLFEKGSCVHSVYDCVFLAFPLHLFDCSYCGWMTHNSERNESTTHFCTCHLLPPGLIG